MEQHYLKIYKQHYDRLSSGQKKFEARFNERDYQVGDIIFFIVIDAERKVLEHSARPFRIEYIHFGFGMQDKYVILGLIEENV